MKFMASLAPARAEIESGVVAKADQKVIKRRKRIDFQNLTYQEL
jgi:hypothetical protein